MEQLVVKCERQLTVAVIGCRQRITAIPYTVVAITLECRIVRSISVALYGSAAAKDSYTFQADAFEMPSRVFLSLINRNSSRADSFHSAKWRHDFEVSAIREVYAIER